MGLRLVGLAWLFLLLVVICWFFDHISWTAQELDPMHIHLWSWRKFLNWTADKATLTHYTTFWAIYTHHVEADTHRLNNYKHRDNQSKHSTNFGVLASITERVHKNRMWSKGHRDNCQYFIRKGNITQVKVNLNKRCKFLCHIYVSADKQGQLKRMREKTSSNVHNVNDALVPAETFGLFTHTWMGGK